MTVAFVISPCSTAASVGARRVARSPTRLLAAAETGATAPYWDAVVSSSAPAHASSSVLGNTLQLATIDTITAATTAATTTATTFEPIAPDTTALLGFASIVVLCAVAAWVWANQVVPVSRTNLALSKRNGPVKEYLDELRQSGATGAGEQQDEASSSTTTTTASSFNNDNSISTVLAAQSLDETSLLGTSFANATSSSAAHPDNKNDRSFERWLFTDWLEKPASKGGRQKPAALPVLQDAKWNSGDNPVLAATGLILLGVLFTAVTERIVQVSL